MSQLFDLKNTGLSLTTEEFDRIRILLHRKTGISLSDGKKTLVTGRLAKRLRYHRFESFGQYYNLLKTQGYSGPEMQTFINLLTTNETYFFRESKHFDFLYDRVSELKNINKPIRIWSAASSTGEEAYSTALTLAGHPSKIPFEIFGSDINSDVVNTARTGIYPIDEARKIPERLLKNFCMKGVGNQSGMFTVNKEIKNRLKFSQVNLTENLPNIGMFDYIFLRNIMIYFNQETKIKILNNLVPKLNSGGYLFIGHSETLSFYKGPFIPVQPSIYRKQ